MLINIDIKNIAVIEDLNFSPNNGMSVLTGETGAGKSVIIDCVNLILGARTNKDMIRYGQEKASVCAMFKPNERSAQILFDNGIECGEEIIIKREIFSDGKSVARINGTMVPVSLLRELSGYLINIHGQHDNQLLLNSEKHIDFLDVFGETGTLLEDYVKLYEELKSVKNEIKVLTQDEKDRLAKIDLLKYQTDELLSADLKSGEEQTLKEEKIFIENAEKISVNINKAYESLYGEENNTYDSLSMAISYLSSICEYDERLTQFHSRLLDAAYSIEDISHELSSLARETDYDQQRLDEISSRLDLIKKLERKYGATVDDCLAFMRKSVAELEMLQNSDARIEDLTKKAAELDSSIEISSSKLTEARKSSAAKLSALIEEQLRDLDMEKAKFFVSVTKSPSYTPKGADNVEFMFSANPGLPPSNLSKIASGGELARVMLAIKTILSSADDTDTLIFDEIDTGVSGGAAQKIAKKLSALGKVKQVICISHQPQLAAAADTNFKIEKHIENNGTITTISILDKDSRVKELARMIDGDNITKTSIEHAKEMLERGY